MPHSVCRFLCTALAVAVVIASTSAQMPLLGQSSPPPPTAQPLPESSPPTKPPTEPNPLPDSQPSRSPEESAERTAAVHRQFMQQVGALHNLRRNLTIRQAQTASADAGGPEVEKLRAELSERLDAAALTGYRWIEMAAGDSPNAWRQSADVRLLLAQIELTRHRPAHAEPLIDSVIAECERGAMQPSGESPRRETGDGKAIAGRVDGNCFSRATATDARLLLPQALVLKIVALKRREPPAVASAEQVWQRLREVDADLASVVAAELFPVVEVGSPAPDFLARESQWVPTESKEGTASNGPDWSLRVGRTLGRTNFAGRPLVVAFWRSDVPVSIALMRELAARRAASTGDEWAVIEVNLDPNPNHARTWLPNRPRESDNTMSTDGTGTMADSSATDTAPTIHRPPWPLVYEGRAAQLAENPSQWLRSRLACHAVPTVVVIDARGRIAAMGAGSNAAGELARALDAIRTGAGSGEK